jgi:hypothetical protein
MSIDIKFHWTQCNGCRVTRWHSVKIPPSYPKNRETCWRRVLKKKVFNVSLNFLSKNIFSGEYLASYPCSRFMLKMHAGTGVIAPRVLPKLGRPQILGKLLNIKFHGTPYLGLKLLHADRWTYRHSFPHGCIFAIFHCKRVKNWTVTSKKSNRHLTLEAFNGFLWAIELFVLFCGLRFCVRITPITCTFRYILCVWSNKRRIDEWAWNTRGRFEKCMQHCGGESWREATTWNI